MTIRTRIAGVDRSSLVVVGSMRIQSRLNTRNRASIGLVDVSGSYRPSVGAEVIIDDGSTTRYFGGFIDSFTEALTIDGNTASLSYEVECVSYDALADRRLVAASYESPTQTLSTIVSDVVTNFLTGDGVTTTNVDTGPVIDRMKFNYVPASQVFDELSNITGYAWWIDESKNLYFKPRGGVAAPITIDASNARRVTVSRTTEVYRNKQLIRAGVDLTASRTENFVGDGTQKAWTLSYPVGAAPTSITVGGVGKTIGIRSVDTGKDWYWNLGDAVVSQDDGAAAVGAGVAIAITYQGQFPILINAQRDSAITEQAALTGASGVYEAIEERPNLNDDEGAQSIAEGLLRRYGSIPRRLTFETDDAGLRTGQLLTATFTPHAVSGSWLVDSVSAVDRNGQDLVWTVEALDGESVGGWTEFFAALTGIARQVEFRENEVIIYLRPANEVVTASDVLTTPSADASDNASGADSNLVRTDLTPENRAGYAQADLSEAG